MEDLPRPTFWLSLVTVGIGAFALTRIPDFEVQWDGVERFEDCGSVYAVRHLPVTISPGPRVYSGGGDT